MGMYDTLNGEQVKCFPWFSYYVSEIEPCPISAHGGSLDYFADGSKIPYRSYSRNYGKDFIIIDFNPYEGFGDDSLFAAHVIKDGILQYSLSDKEGNLEQFNKDLAINPRVVGYYGDSSINVHSLDDIFKYVDELKELKIKRDAALSESNRLFKEFMKVARGLGTLDKDSDEYKERSMKFDELDKKHHEAFCKERDIALELNKEFNDKWITEESDEYKSMAKFGEWLEGCILTMKNAAQQMENDKPSKIINYVDNFKAACKDFKKRYGEKVQDKMFMKKYFEWAECTPEEIHNVEMFFKAVKDAER